MKIAFVGKGGSGKTTLSALFARFLASQGKPVMVIDADINQHLAEGLGLSSSDASQIPALGSNKTAIEDYVRGKNPNVPDGRMRKTTPPGSGSQLVRPHTDDPLLKNLTSTCDGLLLARTGEFTEEDLGISCYHGKIAPLEILLNHLIDTQEEYIITDMTAGADAFASGMFAKFDLLIIVVEPTVRSVDVYTQYKEYAKEFDLNIKVVGNKIENDEDLSFVKQHVGDDLIATLSRSSYIKQMEKGIIKSINELEEENLQALIVLEATLNSIPKDWKKFQVLTEGFHRKNALSWMNAREGFDFTTQIDPAFDLESTAITFRATN